MKAKRIKHDPDIFAFSDGRFYSKKLKRFIAHSSHPRGYVSISIKQKRYLAHRVIAETFINNPLNKPFINHKDGDKKNNNIENLEWVTHSENVLHAVKNRMYCSGEGHPYSLVSSELKKEIVCFAKNNTHADASRRYGISRRTVTAWVNGEYRKYD